MGVYIFPLFFCLSFLAGCLHQQKNSNSWTPLFDGKTLNGWFVVHGDMPFEVRNGEIIGQTLAGIETRYLTTKKQYGDFILELEMNNQFGANSGVQFRSVTTAPFYAGLTGYQLEVDPSARNWTGGIYFEGVGEWRHPPMFSDACLTSWRVNDWNLLRIETKGYQMRTFINDVPCGYLFDQYIKRGHIGLQVHSVGSDPKLSGQETRWRNIRIKENPSIDEYTPDDLTADSRSHLIDALSVVERAKGWQLVKNHSKQSSLWKEAPITNPVDKKSWSVNTLELSAGEEVNLLEFSSGLEGYHVIGNFQMASGTEGEIAYPVSKQQPNGGMTYCNASYRISDDRAVKVSAKDNGYLLMGDLSRYATARNLSEPDVSKRVLFEKSWRWFGIKVRPDNVEHWLNGVKVLEYKGCSEYESLSASSEKSEHAKLSIRIDVGQLVFRNLKFNESNLRELASD